MFDYRTAGLSVAETAICDYAVKLTIHPGDVTVDDVQTLRDAGFQDQQITIAAQVIGYFNYINRIANGLGVESEDWMTLSVAEWKQKKANFR